MIILPYDSSVQNPLPESLIPIDICIVQDHDIQPIATLYVLSKSQDQKMAKFFKKNYRESYLVCYRNYLKKELDFNKIKRYLRACGCDSSTWEDKPFLSLRRGQKITPAVIEILTMAEDICHYDVIKS